MQGHIAKPKQKPPLRRLGKRQGGRRDLKTRPLPGSANPGQVANLHAILAVGIGSVECMYVDYMTGTAHRPAATSHGSNKRSTGGYVHTHLTSWRHTLSCCHTVHKQQKRAVLLSWPVDQNALTHTKRQHVACWERRSFCRNGTERKPAAGAAAAKNRSVGATNQPAPATPRQRLLPNLCAPYFTA